MVSKRLIVSSVAWFGLAGAALSQTVSPPGVFGADVVAARQASMELSLISLRYMAEAMNDGREAKAEGFPASVLAKWAKVVPHMFPLGTGKDEMPDQTHALAAIWKDRDAFDRVAASYAAATDRLAALAKANDAAGFTRQLVIIDQTCRSCHTRYKDGMQGPPLDLKLR
jgi:cytochrome c556